MSDRERAPEAPAAATGGPRRRARKRPALQGDRAWLGGAAAAATSVALMFAFVAVKPLDDATNAAALARIAAVREADARLSDQALLLVAGQPAHYDAVVDAVRALETCTQTLARETPGVLDAAALAPLQQAVAARVDVVERLKTSGALLRNSEHALADALARLEARTDPAPALRDLSVTLAQRTQQYRLTGAAEHVARLSGLLVDNEARAAAADADLAAAFGHARLLLEMGERVRKLSAQLLDNHAPPALAALRDAIEERRADAAREAELVRIVSLVMAALLAAAAALLLYRLSRANSAAHRFVPYEFLDYLGRKNLADIKRGDHVQREVTVLFSDLRGFTELTVGTPASDISQWINDYFLRMEAAIHEHDGFINQFLGDGIMALFHDANDAVAAGVAMQRKLEVHNEERAGRNEAPLRQGIGIHTGRLMLGTVGGVERMDCGVIGDTAVIASRVEGLTKRYGAALLISGVTKALLDHGSYRYRDIGLVRAAGMSSAIHVSEVLDAEPADGTRKPKENSRAAYEAACRAFNARYFEDAANSFAALVELYPADPLFRLYEQRARALVGVQLDDLDSFKIDVVEQK